MVTDKRNSLISDDKKSNSKVMRVTSDEHQQLLVWRDIYNSLIEKFTHHLYNLEVNKIWEQSVLKEHNTDDPLVLVFKYRNIGTLVEFELAHTVHGFWQGRSCTINYHNATIILSLYPNTTSEDLIDRFVSEVIIFQGNHSLMIKDDLIRKSLQRVLETDFVHSLDLFIPDPIRWKKQNGFE